MRKRTPFFIAIVFSCFAIIFGGIGFASWIIENNTTKQYTKMPDSNTQKVAYTQDPNGNNTYFTSIESALKHTSSGNVYVIPGTNPTISSDCTINSGVTLNLPYEDDLKNVHTIEDSGRTSTGDFADKVEYQTKDKTDGTRKVYCKSNVTIADGVTITNNGSIFVGGVLGRNGQAPTGMTVGNYSRITMGSNSKIENKGSITCYGYIKEASNIKLPAKVNSFGSGILNLPIVIYDFRGGSFSSYAVGALRLTSWKAMPFNVFDFPNVQCDVGFSGNSILNGTITVFANDNVVTSSAPIIGPSNSSSLIRLSSGEVTYRTSVPLGYLYDDYSKSVKENNINRTLFKVNGNVDIANMNINVGVSIKTSEFHLPFSYKFNFDFQSGSVNISNKVKFLAGSSVIIDKRASVNVKAETVFYQNYVPVITTGRGDGYPRYTQSAKLINNGTLTIQSSFGGIVLSSSNGGAIKTVSGFSNKVNTNEALTGETGGLRGTNEEHSESAKITLIDKKTYDKSSETAMFYEKSNGILNSDDLSSNKNLTSYKLNGVEDYGWYDGSELSNTTYGIRYVLNSDTASFGGGVESFNVQNASYVLKSPTNSDENLVFDGFSYNANLTEMLDEDTDGNPLLETSKAVSLLNGKNYITLYVKWDNPSKAHYSVDIVTSSTSDHDSEQTNSNSLDLVVGDSFSVDKPSDYYIYENLSVNGNKASGTLTRKIFDGYDVIVYDANGTQLKTISIDSNGSSSDGVFRDYSLLDTSIVEGDYRIDIKSRFTTDSKSFAFTLSIGSTTINPKGSTDVSIALSDANVFNGMTLSYKWNLEDGKGSFVDDMSSSTTLRNGYTGTGNSSTKPIVSCMIMIDDYKISLSMQVTFKKGVFE